MWEFNNDINAFELWVETPGHYIDEEKLIARFRPKQIDISIPQFLNYVFATTALETLNYGQA